MKIIDISQEVFNCNVFPGDPQPQRRVDMSISNGDICNLTSFSMCAHNGTHVDSPYHFYDDGKTMEQVSLSKFVGPYNTNYSQMFAAIIIAIVPTIIVYCAFSNQIVDGLTAGAVKG